jgi:hypothetical protein
MMASNLARLLAFYTLFALKLKHRGPAKIDYNNHPSLLFMHQLKSNDNAKLMRRFFTLLLLQVLKVAFMDPEFSDVTFQFSGNYKAWCDQYHMMIWFVSLLCVFEASTCI